MEGVNFVEFDDVALNHEDQEDDELIGGEEEGITNQFFSNQVDQRVPDEVAVDSSSISVISLPSASHPPRPSSTTHLPPPEVSALDLPESESVSVRWHRQNSRLCLGLGVSQILIGTACVALAIASVVLQVEYYMLYHGMWGGLTLIVCGVVGILASKKTDFSWVTFLLVISFFAACVTVGMFTVSMVACDEVAKKCEKQHDQCDIVSLVVNIVMGVVEMIAFTLTLISAGITARVVFCFTSPTVSSSFSRPISAGSSNVNVSGNCTIEIRLQPPPYTPCELPPMYFDVATMIE